VKRQWVGFEFSLNAFWQPKTWKCTCTLDSEGKGWERANIKRVRNAEESTSCTLARWWMGCG